MQAIQRFLLKHRDQCGFLPIRAVGQPTGLVSLSIRRGHVKRGPRFSHFSARGWMPPQVSNVEGKLRPGRYPKSTIPMELFVHAVHDQLDGPSVHWNDFRT